MRDVQKIQENKAKTDAHKTMQIYREKRTKGPKLCVFIGKNRGVLQNAALPRWHPALWGSFQRFSTELSPASNLIFTVFLAQGGAFD